jgi:transposase InsO family protein
MQIACRATDALEQAIWQKKTPDNKILVHHSDRPSHGLKANRCRATGSQYLSIKYTERLAEAEIDLSVGTVGDAYDRASGRHWFETTGEGPGRMRHRPVQDRGHQPDRPMEVDARSRVGNPEMALRPLSMIANAIICQAMDASIAYRLTGRLV